MCGLFYIVHYLAGTMSNLMTQAVPFAPITYFICVPHTCAHRLLQIGFIAFGTTVSDVSNASGANQQLQLFLRCFFNHLFDSAAQSTAAYRTTPVLYPIEVQVQPLLSKPQV